MNLVRICALNIKKYKELLMYHYFYWIVFMYWTAYKLQMIKKIADFVFGER